MRTADQCLDKALELEFQAFLCEGPGAGDDFRDLALRWRRMACLAHMQDDWRLEPEARA